MFVCRGDAKLRYCVNIIKGYINPFLAIEKSIYKEASEKGYCVKDKEGKDYLVTITTFPAAMIDFTNPEAYEWYKKLIKENMIGLGMNGWMADFGEYLPIDSVLHSGENPEIIHNQWPAIWAKLNREAIEECGKSDEVFLEKTEYLLGRDVIVCPIYKEHTTSRKVYLPKDNWVHIFTGKEYAGGMHTIEAPIGQPPVFVRKDSKDYEMFMGLKKLI